MKVMKFGGSVLQDNNGFSAMRTIIQGYNKEQLIVVISAFSQITRLLDKILLASKNRNESKAYQYLTEVVQIHTAFSEELLENVELKKQFSIFLDSVIDTLNRLRKGVSITREISPRIRDVFASYGEILAVQFVYLYLLQYRNDIACADARECIITDSEYGNANPIRSLTRQKLYDILNPLYSNNTIILIQGYIAANEQGETTTMGLESSNLTASMIGSLLQADEIIIWTNVEGIRTADPSVCKDTLSISHLHYDAAELLSIKGLKVLHKSMIVDPRLSDTKVIIKSAFALDGDSTTISNEKATELQYYIILKDLDINELHNLDRFLSYEEQKEYSELLIHFDNSDIVNTFYSMASTILDNQLHIVTVNQSKRDISLIAKTTLCYQFAQNIHSLLVKDLQ